MYRTIEGRLSAEKVLTEAAIIAAFAAFE